MGDRDSEAYVKLGLKQADFDAGIKRATNSMKTFERDTLSIGRSIKTGFAMLIGSGAVLGIKSLVDAYAQQEKNERMLSAAMKEKGIYTDVAMKHNLEYASSLQQLTTFGDEEIMNAQRIFTNYRIEGDMLDKLTKATLDLAAAKEMDLRGAAHLVAKSVGSSTNALARYGIQIDGSVGSIDRLQSAVDGISKLYGGTAQAAAETYEGKVIQLTNAFGDMQEELGKLMMGPAEQLVRWMKTATDWATKLVLKYNDWASINSIAIRNLSGEINQLQRDLATYDKSIPGDQAIIKRLEAEIKKRKELIKLYQSPSAPASSSAPSAAKSTSGSPAGKGGRGGTGNVRGSSTGLPQWMTNDQVAAHDAVRKYFETPLMSNLELMRGESVAAEDEIVKNFDKISEKTDVMADEMKQAITGWGSHFARTLSDAVWDADVSFASIAESFGRMITEMIMQKGIVEPLLSASFSGANLLGDIFSIATSSIGMAGGGTITEPIYGVGASGQSYTFGEGGKWEDVVPRGKGGSSSSGGGTIAVSLTINAIDAKSFSELTSRNPGAILGPIINALNNSGNQSLINSIRRVV